MTDLKPQRKRRKRRCKYCRELFTPTQSSQQFCKVEHRLTYWRELQTAVSEPLFKEFLEWKRRRKTTAAKKSRQSAVTRSSAVRRKPLKTK
jgi:hypothetical protein